MNTRPVFEHCKAYPVVSYEASLIRIIISKLTQFMRTVEAWIDINHPCNEHSICDSFLTDCPDHCGYDITYSPPIHER